MIQYNVNVNFEAMNIRDEIEDILYETDLKPSVIERVTEKLLNLHIVSKRYYWLKPDGTISNMWNEEDHKKYLTEQDIRDAERDGWQLIQINVC